MIGVSPGLSQQELGGSSEGRLSGKNAIQLWRARPRSRFRRPDPEDRAALLPAFGTGAEKEIVENVVVLQG